MATLCFFRWYYAILSCNKTVAITSKLVLNTFITPTIKYFFWVFTSHFMLNLKKKEILITISSFNNVILWKKNFFFAFRTRSSLFNVLKKTLPPLIHHYSRHQRFLVFFFQRCRSFNGHRGHPSSLIKRRNGIFYPNTTIVFALFRLKSHFRVFALLMDFSVRNCLFIGVCYGTFISGYTSFPGPPTRI